MCQINIFCAVRFGRSYTVRNGERGEAETFLKSVARVRSGGRIFFRASFVKKKKKKRKGPGGHLNDIIKTKMYNIYTRVHFIAVREKCASAITHPRAYNFINYHKCVFVYTKKKKKSLLLRVLRYMLLITVIVLKTRCSCTPIHKYTHKYARVD